MTVDILLILGFFAPLLGGLFGYIYPTKSSFFACAGVSLASLAMISLVALGYTGTWDFRWIPGVALVFSLDTFSSLLIALVLLISTLVHVFSVVYMKQEDQGRYYAKLGFFTFSMVGLLISDHLILLFIFWELVGLASYLLIGFWYRKEGIPSSARMAFMVNRVADVALLSGILLLFSQEVDLQISDLGTSWQPLPSLLICLGAFGKSAQLPFSGWLTKAMVGPTPVSALIHAATMVAAGVYLLVRVSPMLHPDILTFVAIVGASTACYGAMAAMVQHDLKRVLAYSTISQLGYMVVGVGTGASDAAAFHLITHAIFKAGLFLGAGSVIHWMHQVTHEDGQDMRNMGGLISYLPWTFRSFLFCSLALAGLPLFSGFMSKEGVLLSAWGWAEELGTWAFLVPDLALVAVLLTAMYVGRMLLLVFFGELRITLPQQLPRQAKMEQVPLIILGVLSLWIFFSLNPFAHTSWFDAFFPAAIISPNESGSFWVLFLSLLLVIAGLVLSYSFFKPGTPYVIRFQGLKGKPLWLFEGLFLNDAYRLVGTSTMISAQAIHFVDKHVIDRLLNLFAIGVVVGSKALALFDRFFIDGPINFVGWISRAVGRGLAGFSSRSLSMQLTWMLLFFIVILFWFLVF